MKTYREFIQSKTAKVHEVGFKAPAPLPEILFPFQRSITERALKLGRSAIFANCGLGKSLMQISWANQVWARTHKPVLIVAPLAVTHQTEREALKCHYTCRKVNEPSEMNPPHGQYVTNFERALRFDPSMLGGVVLDESSILKNTDGKMRTAFIEHFSNVPYRLACTATPAPNDVMELGNHSEFLGIMRQTEMLSMYFVHDGGETQKWRLKGHAQKDFWRWVGSWCTMARHPRDLGFNQDGYDLPPLTVREVTVEAEAVDGMLVALPASTLGERLAAYRNGIEKRVAEVAKICNASNEQFVVWCRLNEESSAIASAVKGAIEITGSDEDEEKASRTLDFADGKIRVVVTKAKISGFGVNWQNCHNVVYAGVTDSWEQFYQSVRRCYRFGQKHPVNCWIIGSQAETAVMQNLKRKQADADNMASEMVKIMREAK